MKRLATLFFRKSGYSSYFAGKMLGMFLSDLKSKNTTVKQKLWAWRNGFFSDKLVEYNLTNTNKKDYVSDFVYYKSHPLNGSFSRWIDDKLTTKLLLDGGSEKFMPEYYCIIENNIFTPICEGIESSINNYEEFLALLRRKKELAVKKLSGSGGEDFYKVGFEDEKYYINNKEVDLYDIEKLLGSISLSIITEYLHAHGVLKNIYPHAPNAVRLMVIKNEGKFNIIASFIRIGSSRTGVVDNATAGGVFAGICVDTGKIYSPKTYNSKKELISLELHPDTNAKIEVELPGWQSVKDMVVQASEKMGMLRYLGFDIVITPEGPKIIEINSHQTIVRIQKYYPLGNNHHMQCLIKSAKVNA